MSNMKLCLVLQNNETEMHQDKFINSPNTNSQKKKKNYNWLELYLEQFSTRIITNTITLFIMNTYWNKISDQPS